LLNFLPEGIEVIVKFDVLTDVLIRLTELFVALDDPQLALIIALSLGTCALQCEHIEMPLICRLYVLELVARGHVIGTTDAQYTQCLVKSLVRHSAVRDIKRLRSGTSKFSHLNIPSQFFGLFDLHLYVFVDLSRYFLAN
jgi:hypothetical protein